MLVQFVKNHKGNRIGVVVALDANRIGWSLCCPLDRFNRERGINIAKDRAIESNVELNDYGTSKKPATFSKKVLSSLKVSEVNWELDNFRVKTVRYNPVNDAIKVMKDRARRYFKSDSLVVQES